MMDRKKRSVTAIKMLAIGATALTPAFAAWAAPSDPVQAAPSESVAMVSVTVSSGDLEGADPVGDGQAKPLILTVEKDGALEEYVVTIKEAQ